MLKKDSNTHLALRGGTIPFVGLYLYIVGLGLCLVSLARSLACFSKEIPGEAVGGHLDDCGYIWDLPEERLHVRVRIFKRWQAESGRHDCVIDRK